MKIEKINENQIRCTLSSADLSMRNLNLGELAYGTEKARNLFHELIQKASSEVGFEAEDIPLMVEAIPLSSESVMFVITKVEDPEELDTRFSRFSPSSEDLPENLWNSLSSELLEGADGLLDFLKKDFSDMPLPGEAPSSTELPTDDSDSNAEKSEDVLPQTRIFRFSELDQVTNAAHVAGHICHCRNTLFKKPGTNLYYLVLSNQDCDPLNFSRLCNILSEYAEKVRQEAASEAYYQEHYEIIIKSDALQKLMNI